MSLDLEKASALAHSLLSLVVAAPELNIALKISDVARLENTSVTMSAISMDASPRTYLIRVCSTPLELNAKIDSPMRKTWEYKIAAGIHGPEPYVISNGQLSIPKSFAVGGGFSSYLYVIVSVNAPEPAAFAAVPWPTVLGPAYVPPPASPVAMEVCESSNVDSGTDAIQLDQDSTVIPIPPQTGAAEPIHSSQSIAHVRPVGASSRVPAVGQLPALFAADSKAAQTFGPASGAAFGAPASLSTVLCRGLMSRLRCQHTDRASGSSHHHPFAMMVSPAPCSVALPCMEHSLGGSCSTQTPSQPPILARFGSTPSIVGSSPAVPIPTVSASVPAASVCDSQHLSSAAHAFLARTGVFPLSGAAVTELQRRQAFDAEYSQLCSVNSSTVVASAFWPRSFAALKSRVSSLLFAQLAQVLPVNAEPSAYSAQQEAEISTKLYRMSHTQWQRLLDRLLFLQPALKAGDNKSPLSVRTVLAEIDHALSAAHYAMPWPHGTHNSFMLGAKYVELFSTRCAWMYFGALGDAVLSDRALDALDLVPFERLAAFSSLLPATMPSGANLLALYMTILSELASKDVLRQVNIKPSPMPTVPTIASFALQPPVNATTTTSTTSTTSAHRSRSASPRRTALSFGRRSRSPVSRPAASAAVSARASVQSDQPEVLRGCGDELMCTYLHTELACSMKNHRHVWNSVVNPLPCTATQICYFWSRGECRARPTCRFYHWTARELHVFERTGVLPFYAGAGDAFASRPETPLELFKNMPRVLRDRFESAFRSDGGFRSLFTLGDLHDHALLHACAALSVSEAFELCARLSTLQRQRPPPLPHDASTVARRDLLAAEIRAAKMKVPVPGDGERLDKESLPSKYLSLLMKHSGWKHLKSDDFDREALRLLAELPSEKLERCGALLKTPKYAEWPKSGNRTEMLHSLMHELAAM